MNKVEKLRSLIRESIQDYIKEIDGAAEDAAMEARISKCEEAIQMRETKLNAISESDHKDLMDEGKIKALENEIKELKNAKTKFERAKEKKANKKNKKKEVVSDTEVEAPVDEADVMAEMNTTDEVAINESFLKMQKLAGVITESQYNQKKRLIKENKTLSPEEQETLDFILGGENLEEGISQMLDKLKSVARQGALTLGIAAALLNAAPANAKSDIITTINTVAPELDLSTIDSSTAQSATAKEDPIITALTTSLKSTNPYIIKSKTYGDNPIPFTSWNYGANAGKSNATVGFSLSMENGSDIIKISIATVPGKSTAGYEAIVTAAKTLGGKVDQSSGSTNVSISKDKASDVANFVKANVSNLTK
jgi:hypothetical protein